MDDEPDDVEDTKGFKAAQRAVAHGKKARLHKALGCWHARTLVLGEYEFVHDGPVDESRCDAYCAKVWGPDGEEAAVLPHGTAELSGASESGRARSREYGGPAWAFNELMGISGGVQAQRLHANEGAPGPCPLLHNVASACCQASQGAAHTHTTP